MAQMKQQEAGGFLSVVMIIVGLMVIGSMAFQRWAVGFHDSAVKTYTTQVVQSYKDALTGEYLGRHEKFPDSFWLQGTEGPQEQVAAIAAWKGRVEKVLEKYHLQNTMTNGIYDRYHDFRVSEFYNGVTRTILFEKPKDQTGITNSLQGLEVCVVSAEQRQKYKFPAVFYYRQDWQAVMAAAIDLPDAWLGALLYHELGHTYKHLVEHAASATAAPGTDEYIAEEVEMHELEYRVLDAAVQGRLYTLYNRIRERGRYARPEQVIMSVTAADLAEFDRLFEIEHAGPTMTRIALAQFLVGLGNEVIEHGRFGAERGRVKIAYYSFLTR